MRTALLNSAILSGMFTAEETAALHPIGVLLEPEDVAETFAFLCADESRHINGQSIAVDCGMPAG
ncbi:SDR family oxidoreductase [Spirillospora sp. NPDC000708]|uniref:SDR family oxidoreductase n=1 Tax=Actinomadura nitritigenes TaxID=134602 RepID=UPI00336291BA